VHQQQESKFFVSFGVTGMQFLGIKIIDMEFDIYPSLLPPSPPFHPLFIHLISLLPHHHYLTSVILSSMFPISSSIMSQQRKPPNLKIP
jgi:hypothetical protein